MDCFNFIVLGFRVDLFIIIYNNNGKSIMAKFLYTIYVHAIVGHKFIAMNIINIKSPGKKRA